MYTRKNLWISESHFIILLWSMHGNFSSKSVVVTGASRGIGRGIASLFARHGARVMLVAREEQELEAAAASIADQQGTASIYATDVSDEAGMRAMAECAVTQHGGIDILCVNAGIFPEEPLENMTMEQWRTVMTTNLDGTFVSVRVCLDALKRSPAGRVILTSSITGPITGELGCTHYGASKAAQLGFMRSAALELAPHRITVNAVLPGSVRTEGLQELDEATVNAMLARIPLKRLGTPADVAAAVLFLASDEASFITGQTLVVDGGQTLPETLRS